MTDMTFAQRLSEHRRITVLRTLASGPGYSCNESLLQDMLEEMGLTCSRDQVRTELAWLRDQGLVAIDEIGGIYIARITRSGEDVAAGRATVPGVKRPSAAH